MRGLKCRHRASRRPLLSISKRKREVCDGLRALSSLDLSSVLQTQHSWCLNCVKLGLPLRTHQSSESLLYLYTPYCGQHTCDPSQHGGECCCCLQLGHCCCVHPNHEVNKAQMQWSAGARALESVHGPWRGHQQFCGGEAVLPRATAVLWRQGNGVPALAHTLFCLQRMLNAAATCESHIKSQDAQIAQLQEQLRLATSAAAAR
jgi:hypothetical protein